MRRTLFAGPLVAVLIGTVPLPVEGQERSAESNSAARVDDSSATGT